ncbi:hypothetical protein WA026_013496 [Henosepilachna vigintioctopunctata]|uniref:THAP-type domain-containing protein n=1 Tax=Henosepilachna vigintioctopunctata TaxID=420089 RepID=A0AAW1VC23_9CUCU
MYYKWCVVPQCTNTSIKTPQKMFVNLPPNTKIRKKWLILARRNPKDIAVKSHAFMCEDHFNMEKDMANYTQYRMGFSKAIIMVKGAMPSKFECQLDRKKRLSHPTKLRTAYIKRLKTNIDQETKAAPDVPPGTSTVNYDSDVPEMSEEIMVPTYCEKETSTEPISSVDKQIQTNIKVSYRRKAKQIKSKMVRCRAEYMRAYREKKREEKLKSQSEEPKKIARNSTQRSRDFRARAAALRLSQTSTVDPSSALPNLVVSDEVSHLGQEVQHTENILSENTFESYIAKVDKTNLSIDPLSSNVKQEKTLDEFENNIAVWIETDEFENFKSTSAVDNIKQELEDTESLPDDNTFDTYISRVVNVDSSSHPVKEEINAEVWIKTEDDSENLSIDNSVIDNIKQEFEDTGSISNENTFETYISRVVNIDPSNHPVKEEINADVWIKTEDE